MSGPWEDYQTKSDSAPWEDYSQKVLDFTPPYGKEEEAQSIMKDLQKHGMNSNDILNEMNSRYAKNTGNIQKVDNTKSNEPSFLNKTGMVGKEIFDLPKNIGDAALNLAISAPAAILGMAAGNVAAPISAMSGNKEWGKTAKGIQDKVQEYLTYVPQTETGKKIAEMAGQALSAIPLGVTYPLRRAGEYAKEHGEENIGYILTDAADKAAMVVGGKSAKKFGTMGEKVPKLAKDAFNKAVDYGINKGIKPSVSGRGTYPLSRNKINTGRELVKTIIENKNDIILTDPVTDVALPKGSLPTSKKYAVIQMAQAAYQTKKILWKQVDAMQKEATGKGINIDYSPVINMLQKTIEDPSVLGRKNALNYAVQQLEHFKQLQKGEMITPEGKLIKPNTKSLDFNGSEIVKRNATLRAFNKSPQYNDVNSALINDKITNALRKLQDDAVQDTVNGAGIEGYQSIKRKYGAILDHEKDINHRALVAARSNPKGLIDFGDIPIYGELIRSGLTGDFVGAAKSGVWKVGKEYIKRRNNPNYIIANMFKKADKNIGYYGKEFSDWHLLGEEDGPSAYMENLSPEEIRIMQEEIARQNTPVAKKHALNQALINRMDLVEQPVKDTSNIGRPLITPSDKTAKSKIPKFARDNKKYPEPMGEQRTMQQIRLDQETAAKMADIKATLEKERILRKLAEGGSKQAKASLKNNEAKFKSAWKEKGKIDKYDRY